MRGTSTGLRSGSLVFFVAAALFAGANLHAQGRAQAPRTQAPAAAPLVRETVTKKVSTHVWVIPDNNVPLVPNVGIIVGTRATLVVDPSMGLRNGQAVLRAVTKLSKNTELYVVSTNFHTEHSSGVAAFPASAKYIVSQAQQKDLQELAPDMSKQFALRSAAMAALLKDATFRKADISFDKTYELDLGGVKATLMAVGPAGTRGDTAIWVQDEKDGVIFTGDVVMNRTVVPYSRYSSTKVWMDALVQLARLRPANDDEPPVVVPSHGAITDANMIAYLRGFFQAVQARVRELKEQGKPEPEILIAVTDEMKGRYSMWGATDRIASIVANVYQEMR
jgi:glyoxylase-like metal-dependent hydrolase (beta-lactamase superfamily II)